MTDPIMPDPARAERAGRKIKVLQAQIAELEEAVENLKDVIAANLTPGETILGNNDDGHLKFTVYQSKAFNEAYGRKNAPELWSKYAEKRLVLTSTQAKEVMKPDEYAQFQKPSAKLSVKVEPLND